MSLAPAMYCKLVSSVGQDWILYQAKEATRC